MVFTTGTYSYREKCCQPFWWKLVMITSYITFLTSGNKGGVGISFSLGPVSLCFVNCHLAARSSEARVLRSDLFSFTCNFLQYLYNFVSLEKTMINIILRKRSDDMRFFKNYRKEYALNLICYLSMKSKENQIRRKSND